MKILFAIPVIALVLLATIPNINAQENTANPIAEITTVQEGYIELAVENLPKPILETISHDYVNATINKAAANKDASIFKLEITKENGETLDAYYDANGKWITKDDTLEKPENK